MSAVGRKLAAREVVPGDLIATWSPRGTGSLRYRVSAVEPFLGDAALEFVAESGDSLVVTADAFVTLLERPCAHSDVRQLGEDTVECRDCGTVSA